MSSKGQNKGKKGRKEEEGGKKSPTCQDCVSANLKESEWSHWINCATFREKKRAEGVDLEADLQLPHAFGEEEKQEEVEKEEGEEQIVIGDDWEEEVLLDADDAPLRRMPLPSDMSYLGLPVASLMKRDQAKEKSLTTCSKCGFLCLGTTMESLHAKICSKEAKREESKKVDKKEEAQKKARKKKRKRGEEKKQEEKEEEKAVAASEVAMAEEKEEENPKKKRGTRAIHLASSRGHLNIVKRLIDAKAEVDVQDEHGFTPMHFAAACGHNEVVETLCDAGANVNVKDDQDRTPLDLTVQCIMAQETSAATVC